MKPLQFDLDDDYPIEQWLKDELSGWGDCFIPESLKVDDELVD